MADTKKTSGTASASGSARSARSTRPAHPAPKASMPADVDARVGWFDRFADGVSKFVSRAWFFAFCVLLVVVWAPSLAVFHSISIWQLIINTITTIITFLLVALLQNTQERANNAIQTKLNAIADALSDQMRQNGLEADAAELRSAVGLEDRETSDGK